MSHKNALQLLFPVKLSGNQEQDIEIEGQYLDAAQTRSEDLLIEMFADTAYEKLNYWEYILGLPLCSGTLQERRDKVIQKLRETGSLTVSYFINVIKNLGYSYEGVVFTDSTVDFFNTADIEFTTAETVVIEEYEKYKPFMAGWGRAGDTLYIEDVIWIWKVNVPGVAYYQFRVGESAAGERLLDWPAQSELEDTLNKLKPAHTHIIFDYS